MDLPLLLDMAVAAHPDRVVVTGPTGDELRAGRLGALAAQAAGRFAGTGKPRVGYFHTNGTAMPVALFGAATARLPFVPLNYRLSADEAAYVIDNSDAEVVYVDAAYLDLVARVRDRIPKVRDVLVFDGDGDLEGRIDAQPEYPPVGMFRDELAPAPGARLAFMRP